MNDSDEGKERGVRGWWMKGTARVVDGFGVSGKGVRGWWMNG